MTIYVSEHAVLDFFSELMLKHIPVVYNESFRLFHKKPFVAGMD